MYSFDVCRCFQVRNSAIFMKTFHHCILAADRLLRVDVLASLLERVAKLQRELGLERHRYAGQDIQADESVLEKTERREMAV
jgi:hypothetical protein